LQDGTNRPWGFLVRKEHSNQPRVRHGHGPREPSFTHFTVQDSRWTWVQAATRAD
jgi:hypothetical protein